MTKKATETNKKEEKEYRTLQFRITKDHELFDYCDTMCFNAKNLYNVTNFYVRQLMSGLKKNKSLRHKNEKEIIQLIENQLPTLNQIREESYETNLEKWKAKGSDPKKEPKLKLFERLTSDKWFPDSYLLDGVFRQTNNIDYKALPSQSNFMVIQTALNDWKSFFELNELYYENSSSLSGRPKIPKYAKKNGRKTITFTNQTSVIKENTDGTSFLKLPKLNKKKVSFFLGKTPFPKEGKHQQTRIVPQANFYVLELIFKVPNHDVQTTEETSKNIIAIDLGVNNFATITNNISQAPIIIKGGVLKAKNQWYNKQRSRYYSRLREGKQPKEGQFTSRRLQALDMKRHAFMKDTFHKLSKKIVSYCLVNNIDTIVIGKNKDWKTDVTMQKKDKQTFIQIPFNLFISTLTYKANEKGVLVIETEESYTSKASFLDRDDIPTYGEEKEKTPTFSGVRSSRGMYTSFKYGKLNADVNGSANILRKVFPHAFTGDRDSGVLKRPQSWSFKHLNNPLGAN